MIRLQPDWIGELVSICAADDWAGAHQDLGWSEVSPMFRRLVPDMAEADDTTGYSSAEVRACKAALEWLSREHAPEFAALSWELQRWKRQHLELRADHLHRLQEAGRLLAEFVDMACDK